MNLKFKNIPEDPDTVITGEKNIVFHEIEALHQYWNFEGTKGESVILYAADVAHFENNQLKELLKQSGLVSNVTEAVTIARNPEHEYVFLNFNFEG